MLNNARYDIIELNINIISRGFQVYASLSTQTLPGPHHRSMSLPAGIYGVHVAQTPTQSIIYVITEFLSYKFVKLFVDT